MGLLNVKSETHDPLNFDVTHNLFVYISKILRIPGST